MEKCFIKVKNYGKSYIKLKRIVNNELTIVYMKRKGFLGFKRNQISVNNMLIVVYTKNKSFLI